MSLPQLILHFDGWRLEGRSPFATVQFHQNQWRWTIHKSTFTAQQFPFPGKNGQGDARDFFEELRAVMRWGQKYFPAGGAVGMTCYEFARYLEPVAFAHWRGKPGLDLPEMRYTFCETLHRSAVPASEASSLLTETPPPLEKVYQDAIEKILLYIKNGDIYQANYVRRFESAMHVTPSTLFERLWRAHPMPFSALLEWDDFAVVSNSPERFLKIQDGKLRAEPIKGTCPRGGNAREDAALKVLLQNSPKDRAENVMITDLMRNDLGRVCRYGSVRVTALCQVRSFPTLHHLVSVIEGELRPALDALDAFGAAFPCGSITGAPKIRAMQIIDELEPTPRGMSMGAIGYLDFQGNADWNVAIRTVVCKNQRASFHTGGGIVSDSTVIDEWNEMQLKAAALLRALA